MAINGRRNKPIGPGGSTRRLHPCSLLARLPFHLAGSVRPKGRTGRLHRRGRKKIDEGGKEVLFPEIVSPQRGKPQLAKTTMLPWAQLGKKFWKPRTKTPTG